MTVPAVLPHVDAIQAALQAVGLTVYLGQAPLTPPTLYAVLYPDGGTAVTSSMSGDRSDFVGVVQVTCVAKTAEQALWVADKARTALAGKPLNAEGRAGYWPEELGGPPVQRDDDVTPPLFYVPVQYRLRSIPA